MSLNVTSLMKATTAGIAVHKFFANLYKRCQKSTKSSAYWRNSINNPLKENNISLEICIERHIN